MRGRGRGGKGRGRGRRAVRMLEPALLLLLHHGPAHGYTFLDQLEEFGLGDLNPSVVYRALREAVDRNPPPGSGRRRARFYYATQTSSRPFTVLQFMNDPRLVTRNYRKYLESFFRNYFGLRSAPLRLRLRARDRGQDPEKEHAERPAGADVRSRDAKLGPSPRGTEENSDA